MLTLSSDSSSQGSLTRERKTFLLGKLRSQIGVYFGMSTAGDIASALSMAQVTGRVQENQVAQTGHSGEFNPGNSTNSTRVRELLNANSDPVMSRVFSQFLDTSDAARPATTSSPGSSPGTSSPAVRSHKDELEAFLTPGQPGTPDYAQKREKVERCVALHYCGQPTQVPAPQSVLLNDLDRIGFSSTADEQEIKNKLSAFEIIHPLMVPGEKNSELLSVFFNAMPTLELTRATPVLNIKFYSSRQVEQGGKLAAITLHKFLEGAATVDRSSSGAALRAINLATQVTSSAFSNTSTENETYSLVGMELFRAPQTLQNLEASKTTENFLAPVIDPLRPLASIKSLEIEVRSNVGLISTKTAKLEIVLHDRSRMGEFADFIKPDRFGSSFVEIEYGWSHPDGVDETGVATTNPYAQLLNLTRNTDHYGIATSTFSFDEVGQVNISLNLYTRGSSEITEVSIVPGNNSDLRVQIKNLEAISREINDLAATAFSGGTSQQHQRTEIRGQQMLTAAGDAQNHLVLTPDLFRSLRQLRDTALTASGAHTGTQQQRQAAADLIVRLNRLVGEGTTGSAASSNNQQADRTAVAGELGTIQNSVNNEIRGALQTLNRGVSGDPYSPGTGDVFLSRMPSPVKEVIKGQQARPPATTAAEAAGGVQLIGAAPTRSQGHGNAAAATNRAAPGTALDTQSVVSLGTLIMSFVAKPLAAIPNQTGAGKKFSEVQVYFYNFNNKASLMSRCNISQFPVYTSFFAREYSRLRLENTTRAVKMTVAEFITFVANKMVDDPMNPAYGINGLHRANQQSDHLQLARDNHGREITSDEFNRRMSDVMTNPTTGNISGSPDFVMPQITFEIEAVPDASDQTKTILKLHVYDKACSPNSSVREVLGMSNNNLMSTLSSLPGDQAQAAALRQQASAEGSGTTETALAQNWREIHSDVVSYCESNDIIRAIPNTEPRQWRFIGGPARLKQMVQKFVPHIIYGCMGSTVKSANLASKSDPSIASMNMIRSLSSDPIQPNGEQVGGVPLSVYPVDLSITTLGCPMVRYAQELFVDFNTNTTADNIYYVTGLSHHLERGTFDTTIKLTANDAFGQYRNLIGQINNASQILQSASAGGQRAGSTNNS